MATAPFAQATVAFNGGGPQVGGLTAPALATVQLSATNKSGWTKALWRVVGPPDWTTPLGWTTNDGGAEYVGTTQDPPAFVLPSTWGKWMVTLVVNDGKKYPGKTTDQDSELTDTLTAFQILSPGGVEDIGIGESEQFWMSRAWVHPIQLALRELETLISNPATSGPTEFLLPFSTTVHNLVGVAAATPTDIGTSIFDGPLTFPAGAVAYFRGFIDTSGASVPGELNLLDLTNGNAVLATLTGSAQNPQLLTSAAIAFPVGVVNLGVTFRTTVVSPNSYDRVTARGVHLQVVW